jgi:hypothetical protein
MNYLSREQKRKIRSIAARIKQARLQLERDRDAAFLEVAQIGGLANPTQAVDVLIGSSGLEWDAKNFGDRLIADVELFFVQADEKALEAAKNRIRKTGVAC